MGHRTGNRNTGRAKAIGSGLLAGLAALGEAAHDGPRLRRIEEIDDELVLLKRERDFLISELYEPGDLEVSDDYDRFWRPTEVARPLGERPVVDTASTGEQIRWIACKGRETMSVYHDAHPDCPHVEKRHNAHEFPYKF